MTRKKSIKKLIESAKYKVACPICGSYMNIIYFEVENSPIGTGLQKRFVWMCEPCNEKLQKQEVRDEEKTV